MIQGYDIQLVKGWVVRLERGVDLFHYCYCEREEAIREARALHRLDRQDITGIYETWLAVVDGCELCPVWSEEEDGINSIDGIPGGAYVSDEELEDIIKNGRGF